MKQKIFFLIFFLSVVFCYSLRCDVRFVCGAALIEKNYEARKKEYIDSLLLLQSHGLSFYIIEPSQKYPTFLDSYCDNVCYTDSQIHAYSVGIGNYGINEVISFNKGLRSFNFALDDMIIKFNLRYQLQTTEFIELVTNNLDADAIVRVWEKERVAYTALCAMKLKYFFEFFSTVDINMMVQGLPVEACFYRYIDKIRNEGKKIVYLPKVYDYLPCWFASH